ncbi:lipase member H-like [Helicoverpa zea]|uniref:lipase member H-like n=1 Tax=Helicoverpa zea TaxID=7113 RepID=UPI001F57E39D|nr:lipase member H-like [Helicoverpa zea]
MFTSVCTVFLLIGAVLCGDDKRAKLRFYHGVFENYTEFPIDECQEILSSSSSWYNSSRMTTIFTHGFTGHPNGFAVTSVIKAYLEQGQSNVALLNWDRLAAVQNNQMSGSYLKWAAPNAIKLGSEFADVLLNLSSAGLDLNKTHLVGHSLGAQIFGITGNKMVKNGVQLPWITGLDPAGIMFDGRAPADRLSPTAARFVDVIHSDPTKYGTRKELGTVDFWPNYRNNGPVIQPGCDNKPHPRFSLEDLCNHNKCWQFLIDTIKYPGSLMGTYAKNFRTWKNYSKKERLATVLELGVRYDKVIPGNYYFLTGASSPYGLAENGL